MKLIENNLGNPNVNTPIDNINTPINNINTPIDSINPLISSTNSFTSNTSLLNNNTSLFNNNINSPTIFTPIAPIAEEYNIKDLLIKFSTKEDIKSN